MVLFLLLTVICWMFVDSESAGSVQKTVSAVEGQEATLTCEAPNNETIRVVEWTRPDLGDQEVLLYRGGKIDPDNHLSYQNRVDLKDRTMKDGDVSLILKNVAFSDSGTFKCFIKQRGEQSRKKRSAEDTSSTSWISLSVVRQGDMGGPGGNGGGRYVVLIVAALVVVGVILGVVMFPRCHKKQKSPPPPDSGPGPDEPLNRVDAETQTEVSGDSRSSRMKTMETQKVHVDSESLQPPSRPLWVFSGGSAGLLHPGGSAGLLHPGGSADLLHPGGSADLLHPGGSADLLHPGGSAGLLLHASFSES